MRLCSVQSVRDRAFDGGYRPVVMTHEQARKLLDQYRHGIQVCATLGGAIELLVGALHLLEDDRRLLRDAQVNVLVGVAPRVES
jgi:hypothetical protein